MKRFYCTICKKVKRVRRYPRDIQAPDSTAPVNRIGTCTYHSTKSPNYTQFKRDNLVGMSGKVAR